jgi:ABC-type multidrug transport system permease subunit
MITYLVFILILMSLVGNSIGFLTGSLFKDVKKASGLSPVLLLPLMMFSGMYNKLNSIPSWISWVQYISPFRYGLHMSLINQYGDSVVSVPGKNFYYDYREDLAITLNWIQNFGVLIGLSSMFYCLSFYLLRKSQRSVSV